MIYGYARVSTDRQDNSLEAQSDRIGQYVREVGGELAELFVDRDQSAYKIKLNRRREGKRLCDALQPGDTVVFTKIDRCFRSLQDQCNQLQAWDEQGITYIVLDLPIQLQTPYGRLTLNVLGATSQLSSELTGMRVREVNAYLKAQGRPYSSTRPFGWVRGKGEYLPCPKERALGQRVIDMRRDGLTYAAICLRLGREGVRKPQTTAGSRGYYSLADIWNLHRAAQAGYPRIATKLSPADWSAALQSAAVSDAGRPAPAV